MLASKHREDTYAQRSAKSHRGGDRRGSGIGRAIALGFAREGATVAALDIDGATAAKTSAGILGAGGKAHVKRERMPAKIVRQLCLAASFRKRPSSDVLTRLSELLDEAL